uniref:Uncharacterized protein n=1 Tax=Tetraselmis sp. GSL018 TaxID=582737 RepID=A0A061RWB0_9CHLO
MWGWNGGAPYPPEHLHTVIADSGQEGGFRSFCCPRALGSSALTDRALLIRPKPFPGRLSA